MQRANVRKTLIVNRAVPGSGKTTISNCIVDTLKARRIQTALHSTDEYFLTADGRYVYDVTKLNSYHQKNFKVLVKSLEAGIDVVICDNVNLSPWQTRPYTEAARRLGYYIIFVTFEPRELSKHLQSQQVTAEKPDAHGVPEEVIISMIEEYHAYNSLLDKNAKLDPDLHIEYSWDNVANKKVPTGKLSHHFDLDGCIEILPHEYKEVQPQIGHKILSMITLSK